MVYYDDVWWRCDMAKIYCFILQCSFSSFISFRFIWCMDKYMCSAGTHITDAIYKKYDLNDFQCTKENIYIYISIYASKESRYEMRENTMLWMKLKKRLNLFMYIYIFNGTLHDDAHMIMAEGALRVVYYCFLNWNDLCSSLLVACILRYSASVTWRAWNRYYF